MEDTNVVLPIHDKNNVVQAFKAIVRVCFNENLVLLCKYVRSANSQPKIVVLIPKIKKLNEVHTFIVHTLPY